MKLVTDTPLRVGWMPWCFGPGDWRLVVAAKATVELPREGIARLAEEQAFLTGDMFWEDDPERSLRYAEDLALLKPQGETWVSGTLRTAEPITELACLARVGDVEMRFDVIGDRWWREDGGQTAPVPFTEMPLCWERCFGGPGFEANPVGRGVGADPRDPAGRVALPNIERHGRLVRSVEERPEPAGVWPVPRTWPERMRLLGTAYDGAYLRERWPYFAEDFRWSHFQAARDPQRIAGYWRGDETIELAGLHPEHPRLRCRLPGLRARAFVLPRGHEQGPLREIPMVLDTISIDAGAGTASLVWRGSTACADESLDELTHFYVRHEPLEQVADDRGVFTAFVARLRAMWKEEQAQEPESPRSPPPGAPEPPEVPAPDEAAADPREAARARAHEQGWPEETIDQLYPRGPRAEADRDERRRSLEAARATAAELGLGDVAETFARAIERHDEQASEPDSEGEAHRPEPPPGLWTAQELRDQVTARIAAGESLARLVLTGADLSLLDLAGQDLSGCVMNRADLRGATFDRAVLDGAVLDSAQLENATFREASLREASLSFVEADGVDFTGAVLEGAIAERAMLTGACFERARAAGITLEECLAVGASFVSAELSEAELPRTNFDEADFFGATMADARLEGASLRRASMDQLRAPKLRASDGADLSEATLRYADLSGATFARSTLIGTKLTESVLTRATFAEARLEGAELLAVDATGARFANARMSAASLAGANLLGARFEGAVLTSGDLSSSNLYGAELWKAELTNVRLDGANVEGTKLA